MIKPVKQESRWIFWFLISVWFVPLLGACDQSLSPVHPNDTPQAGTAAPISSPTGTNHASTDSPNETPTPVRRLDLEAEDLRGTIIHYWHIWSGTAGTIMESLIDEFNLNNEYGIVVVPLYQQGLDEMSTQVSLAIGEGDAPDLVVGYLHQALAWDETGKLVNLGPYVEDSTWGYSLEAQEDYYPVFWEQDVFDGKRLGVPAQRSGQFLFYNATWAKELGFRTPPVLPKQFQEQACAAAKANLEDPSSENDGTGGWIISTNYAAMMGWIYSFGGEIIKRPEPGLDQSVYQFDAPEIGEAFTFLRGLYDDGCAWVTESHYPDADFANRLGLFATGSVLDVPYQVEAFRDAGNQDQWTLIPFPSPTLNPAIQVYGPSFVVLASSQERQLASWVFIKWLITPQNQARLIETSGALPLRASTLNYLEEYKSRHPQWASALETLPIAHSEPAFKSWGTVRWALSDASTQLFRSYFDIDQIPGLLEFLDQTAAELHIGPELSGVFDTPTSTPAPSATATATLPPSPTATFTRTSIPSATSSLTPTPSSTTTQSPTFTPTK